MNYKNKYLNLVFLLNICILALGKVNAMQNSLEKIFDDNNRDNLKEVSKFLDYQSLKKFRSMNKNSNNVAVKIFEEEKMNASKFGLELIEAIQYKELDLAEKIIISGNAEFEIKNDNLNTALMVSSYNGYKKIVKLLLSFGANVNSRGYNGQTALIIACFNGGNNKEIIKLLLESGADINAFDHSGNTAYNYASQDGHKEIVDLLIEAGLKNNNKI